MVKTVISIALYLIDKGDHTVLLLTVLPAPPTAGTVSVNPFHLDVFSISIPGQVETPHKIRLDNTSELHLTHLYTLHNLGPSPFPHGQLTIRLPHTPLVWLNNVRVCSFYLLTSYWGN